MKVFKKALSNFFKYRKLYVQTSGKWYILLTIILGVVAMSSGNNVVYLIESLLLSGLILSGMLSELALTSLRFEIVRKPTTADEKSSDIIKVTHTGKFPLYCVEIGEWKNDTFQPHCFISNILPGETQIHPSERVFTKRGWNEWDGIALSTKFPFGFARKTRIIYKSGKRIIWPRKSKTPPPKESSDSMLKRQPLAEPQIREGELRPMTWEDDVKHIVWSASAKSDDSYYVRVTDPRSEEFEIRFDLQIDNPELFEKRILDAAWFFYEGREENLKPGSENYMETAPTLVIVDGSKKEFIRDPYLALNELAIATPKLKGVA